MIGLLVDLMVYTIIIPVLPFRLQDLHYTGISGLTGWLLFAYVCEIFRDSQYFLTLLTGYIVWRPCRL